MSFPLMPPACNVEPVGPTVAYTDLVGSSSNTFTYSFTSRAIGAASADRIVVVCAMINAISTTSYGISSITINGAATTIAASSSAGKNSVIAYALVPTGTTANIVVNLSGSGTPGRCVIGLFTVKDYQSAVPEDTASAYSDTSVSSLTVPVDASSNSVAISCCYVGNNGTNGAAWTAPMVEVFDSPIESTTFTAALSSPLPHGPTDVTVTPPVSIDLSMSAVVWR